MEPVLQEALPDGPSWQQTNERATEVITNLYREAFPKGIPKYYRDAWANPDSSEDLVSLDLSMADYTLIKHLVSKGRGSWAFVLADS